MKIEMNIYRIKIITVLVLMVFTTNLIAQVGNSSQTKSSYEFPDFFPLDIENFKRLSSGYGFRVHPLHRKIKKHKGIDLVAKRGSTVYASARGVVLESGYDKGYGNYILLRHGKHTKTLYAHLLGSIVKKGRKVKKGQIIGAVGDTGMVTGPHLHYEIRIKGKQVNPLLLWKNIQVKKNTAKVAAK